MDQKYAHLELVDARMAELLAAARDGGSQVVMAGDLNVVRSERDIKNWKPNHNKIAGVMDEEIALLSVAPGFHFTLHTYPALGYVAVDLYSFEQTLPLTLIMKALRKSFRAEKVKATSVQRGDFGNERDMKPRRKTKITTLGRVSRTRIQLKQTGGKLKKQSAKVIKTLAKKSGLKK